MRWYNLTGGGSQTETRQYNALGQMTRLTVPGQLDLEYRFSATANDNKAISQNNYISGEELEYQYDSLGRLSRAETTASSGSAPQWGLSWVYDGFGNRLQQNAIKGTVPTQSILVDPVTNRVQSHSFDANGNTTSTPAQGTMTYDVTDRLKTVASDAYNYSPANQRQWKNNDFVLWGADGQRLVTAQVALIGSDLRFTQTSFDSYSHGRRLQVSDRLGSVGSYYPYGDAKSGTVSNADSFATYYRDSTALDYAQQRYYQPASGRFLTTDPLQASAKVDQPESWNRYPYAVSDPVNLFDPSGLAPIVGPACVQLGVTQYQCTGIAITSSGTFIGIPQVGQDLSSLSGLALTSLTAAGGWNLTLALLTDAASSIAQGLSADCWNSALSLVTGVGEGRARSGLSPLNVRFSASTLSARLVRIGPPDRTRIVFSNALLSTDPSVIAAMTVPDSNAFTYYGESEINWRPGENGFDRRPANWLLGNVLHEALHTFGFSDEDLQASFGLTVSRTFTDNISGFLATRCFAP